MNTTKGTITVRLFARQAPETVENFVGLAEGTKQWVDPTTGRPSTEPLYNGTIFHRVISGFMIQGGDPLGNGRGGPGYKFKDEFDSSLKFDRPYLLAMANAGPNTNGSQFFITVGTPDWLNNKHTIFGEVVSGTEVVDAIAGVKTNAQDRPVEDVVISSVEIERS
nr:peptidylprolyl isomerase [Streptomonospora nanhaiensis]